MERVKFEYFPGNPAGKISVDLAVNEIYLTLTPGQSFSVDGLYVSLKNAWRYNEVLMKYRFPVKCNTLNRLIIVSPWKLIIQEK